MSQNVKTCPPFEAAAYLDSEEAIAEYLAAAAEDPNQTFWLPPWAT